MSHAALRSQDHYKAVTRELKAAGLEWREEFGGKHARLVISVNGREEVEVLSLTPSDHRAPAKARSHIRRRIKAWKAEAATFAGSAAPAELSALEKETMDQSQTLVMSSSAPTMSSREIAELTGKRHDNVRADIERMAKELSLNFQENPEATKGGRPAKVYTLDKRECLILVSGYSIEMRARIIDRWIELETQVSAVPVESAMLGILADMESKVSALSSALQALLPGEGKALIPAFDFAGSVTALEIISMAGVPPDQRVRGTSAAVTLRMKDFCLSRGLISVKTPPVIDASERRRFPIEAARDWLTGASQGAEFIRSHVTKRRAEKGAGGQLSLILGGKS